MNEILQLKGQLHPRESSGKGGSPKLPKGAVVSVGDLERLRTDLINVLNYWKGIPIPLFDDILVCVNYKRTIAKSNRIKSLLPNKPEQMVGARFSDNVTLKHIITHYVKKDVVQDAIRKLDECIKILNQSFKGSITHEQLDFVTSGKLKYTHKSISKSDFARIMVDTYYVEHFTVQQSVESITDDAIITIYQTNTKTDTILQKLGINPEAVKKIDETTMLLYPDQFSILKQSAPFLVSMATHDLSSYTKADFDIFAENSNEIPLPSNEPIIGVIDTLFSENVYFADWVDYRQMIDEELPISEKDYYHGTAVSSIIVDGSFLNPELDDGCGRFRVRHFGVATSGRFSSFSILQSIKTIVKNNPDIKVWNLSLGSEMPTNLNFISPEAAELDRIQYENDVIFVVAGTNKSETDNHLKIGSPADSINALVVNSVDFNSSPASYSRSGPVLSFFHKPDISYFGGDSGQKIKAYTHMGETQVKGTSFAAPWISRKMAYLIHVMGLNREVAKALIIDSAARWEMDEDPSNIIGYGVVPTRIEEIVQTPSDEIKFILTGTSEKYDTYSYNIPVPLVKDKHPFIAKATLCYFPKCSRNQGVDYTNTELDLHFGRVNGSELKTVNDNKQGDKGLNYMYEKEARAQYRKWDNVKHIYEKPKERAKAKKSYGNGSWGISVKKKERLFRNDGTGINFGVIITLKEITGVNRIEEFIHQCSFRGWLVNKLDVQNRVDVYVKAEEEIRFD